MVGLVLLGGSVGLARFFAAGAAERDSAIDVLRAQSRGDGAAVLDQLKGCRADTNCRARTTENVARLNRAGRFKLLRYDGPKGGGAVLGRTGTARVAWRAGTGPAVVQCIRLRREGDPLQGYDVSALSVSAPIAAKASCPR